MIKVMKNIAKVMLALAVVTFASCGPDVDPVEPDTPEVENGGTTDEEEGKEEGKEDVDNTDPNAPAIIPNNGIGEDGKIALNSVAYACYFGNVWDTGVADYYMILTNDDLATGANGFEVPLHQGGWLLYLDLWSYMSKDTANAVLPEGEYTFGSGRDMWCFYHEFSLAVNNKEQVLVDGTYKYRIQDHGFQSGTVKVTHVAAGYHIEAEVVTLTGETYSFVYEGAITFDDESDDEEWRTALDMDINLEPAYGALKFYSSYESANCDNYVIELFNTTELTSDKVHPNVLGGVKLQLDIYPEFGKGVTGEYVIGTLTDDKYLLEKEPWVYYPGCYWGTMALGTFVEYVDVDGTVLYSVVKDGILKITENADGTYTINVDFTTERQKKITCNWTGELVKY